MAGTKGWVVCKAHRTNGEPCRGPAVRGTGVCKKHGGSVRAVKAAGQRRYAVQKAREEMAKRVDAFNEPLAHVSPAEALQEELNRTRGNVLAMNAILAERGIESLMVEVSEETRTGGLDAGTTKRVASVIGPFVEVYLREREQLHRVARTAMQTSLEAWRIHLNSRTLDLVELGMLAALKELGYAPDDPRARVAMSNGMRAMQDASRTRQVGKPEALLKPPMRGRQ